MSAKEGVSTLVKVARAIERGTLPGDLTVERHGHAVNLSVPRHSSYQRELELEESVLVWLRHNYSESSRDSRDTRAVKRTRGRGLRPLYFDTKRWMSVGGEIQFNHLVPHEHQSLHGSVTTTGVVTWICNGCRRSLPEAEARKRGLLR